MPYGSTRTRSRPSSRRWGRHARNKHRYLKRRVGSSWIQDGGNVRPRVGTSRKREQTQACVPTAGFTFPPPAPDELEVTFTDTSEPCERTGAPIVSYAWVFMDGSGATSSDQNPTHTFSGVGTFPVTLTVTDQFGFVNAVTQFVTTTAAPPNNPPLGVPSATPTGNPFEYTIGAAVLFDSDGVVVQVEYDTGDGAPTVTFTGANVNDTYIHTYPTNVNLVTYVLTLTTTDDDGGVSVSTIDVDVPGSGP